MALSSIAQEAHLSEYHFIRLFKKLFGRTPYQYVLHLRLQQAHVLMQQGHGVAEVAFQTGFADKSAFCKARRLYPSDAADDLTRLLLGCRLLSLSNTA